MLALSWFAIVFKCFPKKKKLLRFFLEGEKRTFTLVKGSRHKAIQGEARGNKKKTF